MREVKLSAGGASLIFNGAELLAHSPERPFAVAERTEKSYKSSRGVHKSEARVMERLSLCAVRQRGDCLIFSAAGHELKVTLREHELGWRLELQGQEGWSYIFSLPAVPDEPVFGGGEQYRKLNLRGERVSNFVSEHIKAGTIVEKALLPTKLYREKEHRSIGSYSPMPVFVTGGRRLISFNTTADGWAEFGRESYKFSFDRCPESLLLLRGASFEELSRAWAQEIPNRQYLPEWCYEGMILGVQGGTDTVESKAYAMQDAGAAICGVWVQDWCGELRTVMGKQVWWNWEQHPELYPGLRDSIARLRARGIRFLGYINPYLVKDSALYCYCRDRGWLIKNAEGEVYHIKSTTFDAGMLDLTNPEAAEFIKRELIGRNMLGIGMAGYMADFGEYLPTDCVLHKGDPKELHNLWPVLWAKLNREAIEEYGDEETFFFTRSGYSGIQSYAPIMWNGDQHTDYSRDYGLPCVIPASLSLGFSGVGLVHCDTGGFFSFGKMRRREELFIRWMELCCFSPLMRSHESIRPWANIQFDAPEVIEHCVRLSTLHRELAPYLKHCAAEVREGLPVMRPDFYHNGDYSRHRDEYAYFLGSELFVAPIVTEGQTLREVYLPEGDWVHLWTGREYGGGREYTLEAQLGQIPVFYRQDGDYAPLFAKLMKREK